jgi:exosortase/archaeosortase family protein
LHHVLTPTEKPHRGLLYELAGSLAISRNALFGALVVMAFANGLTENIAREIGQQGVASAVLNTFGISVFVWAALVASIVLLWRGRGPLASPLDLVVAVFATLAILFPIPTLSWLAITAIGLYLLVRPGRDDQLGRAGAILLAMTVPLFWSRVLMSIFGEIVLGFDASMVSWLVGTSANGNVVPFADGSGAMWIAPSCSSLSNMSLAILCSVLFINFTASRWSAKNLAVALCACIAVVVINVVRIGLIGLYPAQFDLIHGEVGSFLAGWLTTVAIVAISYYGLRPRAPAAA